MINPYHCDPSTWRTPRDRSIPAPPSASAIRRARIPAKAFAKVVVSVLALLVAVSPSIACDSHALYTGTLMQTENTGVFLGVFEQYTDFSDVRANDKPAPNTNDEWIHSSITQLLLGYSFTPDLGIQVNVPLISRDYRQFENGSAVRRNVGGLGDVSVMARYAPISQAVGSANVRIELFAGIKTPTGSSGYLNEAADHHEEESEHQQAGTTHDEDHHDDDEVDHGDDGDHDEPGHHGDSVVHGHDLALGSGSVDGLFGLNAFATWKRFFATARIQYSVRGDGDYSYNFANDVFWEVAPGFFLLNEGAWTISTRLMFSGDYKARDKQYGALQSGTDLTSVLIGPGLGMSWTDAFQGDLAVAVPILQDVTDPQLVATYRLRVGLTWRF